MRDEGEELVLVAFWDKYGIECRAGIRWRHCTRCRHIELSSFGAETNDWMIHIDCGRNKRSMCKRSVLKLCDVNLISDVSKIAVTGIRVEKTEVE